MCQKPWWESQRQVGPGQDREGREAVPKSRGPASPQGLGAVCSAPCNTSKLWVSGLWRSKARWCGLRHRDRLVPGGFVPYIGDFRHMASPLVLQSSLLEMGLTRA